VKLATKLKIRKPSGITLLNVVALAMLTCAVSNKISQDHRAQIDSAVRASDKLVKAMLANREMAGMRGPGPGAASAFDYTPVVACPGRFE
jgi:hypothetical protein